MAELEAEYRGRPLSEIPDEDGGDFGNDLADYRWELRSRELELPDLSALLTSQNQSIDENLINMIKQSTEFLSRAIKEVRLSVFIKARGKEVEYAVTTYFVDYDQQLGLPGVSDSSGGN